MAFLTGYFIGAKDGTEGFDEVATAFRKVTESEEFDGLIQTLRSHAGHTLQELGKRIASEGNEPLSMGVILHRTRGFAQRSATGTAS
jgi:hypothetical protein